MSPPHSAVHFVCVPATQFLVIVVELLSLEPVVLRRNDKDNPQAQNEIFTSKV